MGICNCSFDTIIPCPYHKAGYKLFDVSQMYEIPIGRNSTDDITIIICPDCANHPQGGTEFNDCKNLFWRGKYDIDGKKIVSQCCCYSEAHGERD
jgi:hypothetical protein